MKRLEILETAIKFTTNDRNKQHGEPEESFGRIAEYWSVYLKQTLTASDVAILMNLFKVARVEANPVNPDSWIDAAGYMACGGEIATEMTAATDAPPASVPVPDHVGWIDVKGLGKWRIQPNETFEFDFKDGSSQYFSGLCAIPLNNVKRLRKVPNDAGWIDVDTCKSWETRPNETWEFEFNNGSVIRNTTAGVHSLDCVKRIRQIAVR